MRIPALANTSLNRGRNFGEAVELLRTVQRFDSVRIVRLNADRAAIVPGLGDIAFPFGDVLVQKRSLIRIIFSP